MMDLKNAKIIYKMTINGDYLFISIFVWLYHTGFFFFFFASPPMLYRGCGVSIQPFLPILSIIVANHSLELTQFLWPSPLGVAMTDLPKA